MEIFFKVLKFSIKKRLKLFLVMKFLSLFMFAGILQMSASVYSQGKLLNLSLQDASFEEVLTEIRNQSEFTFLYNSEDLDELKKVDLEVSDAKVEDVLNKCLTNSKLDYQIKNKVIVIKEAEFKPKPTILFQQRERTRIVIGTVTDGDHIPMPGANVMIPGSTKGVSTNANGFFKIEIPVSVKTLQVSYIGYTTAEILVGSKDNIKVVLKPDSSQLDEITVTTGIFTKKRGEFTGVATTISGKELEMLSSDNILTSLQTIDPSLQIMESNDFGSDPNQMPDILIRGRSAMEGEKILPTFVLDGAIVNKEVLFDFDMSRIRKVTVLKDASATALYGSRGANGVIVIETHAPKSGKIRISYNSDISIQMPDLSGYDLMNAEEKLEYERLAGLYHIDDINSSSEMNKYEDYLKRKRDVQRGVDTYWMSQALQTPITHKHSLFLEGGSEFTRYGVTVRHGETKGIMKGSDRTRSGINVSFSYNVQGKLFFRNNFDVTQVDNQNSPYGSFSQYTSPNPYDRIYDEDDNYVKKLSWNKYNPLYEASLSSYDRSAYVTLRNNFSMDWTIMNNLKLRSQITYEKKISDSKQFKSPLANSEIDRLESYVDDMQDTDPSFELNDRYAKIGWYKQGNRESKVIEGRVTLAYFFKRNRHTLNLNSGADMRETKSSNSSFKATGFPNDKLDFLSFATEYDVMSKPSGQHLIARNASTFFNFTYGYASRYIAEYSYSMEGSSVYGKNAKFSPFWSTGVAWNIHKENFVNKKIIKTLRLKASYGFVGRNVISDVDAFTMFNYHTNYRYDKGMGSYLKSLGNPDLKPQRVEKINYSLEVNISNRLTLTSSIYSETTKDWLQSMSVAPSIGFTSFKQNVGEIQNQGVELRFGLVPIKTKNFTWRLSVGGFKNKNKIKNLSEAYMKLFADDPSKYKNGEDIAALKVVRSLGIDPMTGKEVYIDRNGQLTNLYDPKDKVVVGSNDSDLRGNISTSFFFKNWQFSFSGNYELGRDKINSSLMNKVERVNPRYNADRRVLTDRWKQPGDNTGFMSIKNSSYDVNSTTRFLQTENMLMINNVAISYNLPRNLCKRIYTKSLRFTGRLNNIARFSNIKEERGLNFPYARTISFSVKIQF